MQGRRAAGDDMLIIQLSLGLKYPPPPSVQGGSGGLLFLCRGGGGVCGRAACLALRRLVFVVVLGRRGT